MSAVNVSPVLEAMIQPLAMARNGQVVGAPVEQAMRDAANQLLAYRGKELFAHSVPIDAIPDSDASTRVRWRFAQHTSRSCARIHVYVLLARRTGTDALAAGASFEEETTAQTLTFTYGNAQNGATDVPSEWAEFHGVIDVDPDTDVYGVFRDITGGRLIAALVYEEPKLPDTANGYLAPVAAGDNIYDEHRRRVANVCRDVWEAGGSSAWHATVEKASSAPTNTTTTFKNFLDTSETSLDESSLGVTLDMTGKTTVMRESTGVSVVMKVYASVTSAAGKMRLKDSGGGTALEVPVTGTAAWYAVRGDLPVGVDKYDLHFALDSAAGTMTVHAVSIYEYNGAATGTGSMPFWVATMTPNLTSAGALTIEAMGSLLVEDDLLLAFVESEGEAITADSASTTLGWAQVADSPQFTTGGASHANTRLGAFWLRITAQHIIDYGSGGYLPFTTDATGHFQIGQILLYRGCTTSGNPWDVTAGNVTDPADDDVTLPGDTTTDDRRLVVLALSHDNHPVGLGTDLSNADLDNLTYRTHQSYSFDDEAGGFYVYDGSAEVAGAFDPTVGVLTSSRLQAHIVIALKGQP